MLLMTHPFTKGGGFSPSNSVLPHYFLLKCPYQARNANDHVFMLGVTIFPLSTIFLLDFRTVANSGIFCFSFCILPKCQEHLLVSLFAVFSGVCAVHFVNYWYMQGCLLDFAQIFLPSSL